MHGLVEMEPVAVAASHAAGAMQHQGAVAASRGVDAHTAVAGGDPVVAVADGLREGGEACPVRVPGRKGQVQ
jgi:hypothetical protein